jgi:hypothetical protein
MLLDSCAPYGSPVLLCAMLVCTSAPVLQCSCTLVLLRGRAPVGGALCGGSAAVLLCGSDAAWRCC